MPDIAETLAKADAYLARPGRRVGRCAFTLPEHQDHLRRTGIRPLDRETASRIYPADEVARVFDARPGAEASVPPDLVISHRHEGMTTVVYQGGNALFRLPWLASREETAAAVHGWCAALEMVAVRADQLVDQLVPARVDQL